MNKNGVAPVIHVPVPQRIVDQLREGTFLKLAQRACIEAEKRKGEPLTKGEADEVCEKLREHLERRGFFKRK